MKSGVIQIVEMDKDGVQVLTTKPITELVQKFENLKDIGFVIPNGTRPIKKNFKWNYPSFIRNGVYLVNRYVFHFFCQCSLVIIFVVHFTVF